MNNSHNVDIHIICIIIITPSSPTNIVDLRGFDSSIILISRGGIPRPIGNFPEDLSREVLVGLI